LESISLSDGKVVDTQDYKAPLGIYAFEYADQITMTLPLSAKETMFRSVSFLDQYKFNFTAKDYNTAYTSISDYLRNDSGFAKSVANNLYSPRMNSDSVKVLLLILKIFTYGFIILISLIVIANIFNTISTNVMLRRKEFAMLKSVGMTLGGFDRMMNYECLLYTACSLLQISAWRQRTSLWATACLFVKLRDLSFRVRCNGSRISDPMGQCCHRCPRCLCRCICQHDVLYA